MTSGKVFEVLLQVRLDPPEDVDLVEYAQEEIEMKLNAGEFIEICRIFSVRPIPAEELGEEALVYGCEVVAHREDDNDSR